MGYKKNVTMIDELPDLNDLESKSALHFGGPAHLQNPDNQRPKNMEFVQKFIRDTHNGMQKYDEINQSIHSAMNFQPNEMRSENLNEDHLSQGDLQRRYHVERNYSEDSNSLIDDNVRLPKYKEIHCVDIIDHIKDCPVCCKIYNNNEKTIYIVIIIILVIICAFLLKKVLES
jgi:hypothetical protein